MIWKRFHSSSIATRSENRRPWILILAALVALVTSPALSLAQSEKNKDGQAEEKKTNEQDDSRAARRRELAAKREAAERFMRVRKNGKGQQVALETSIVRYQLTNEKGETISVDLIGAVHIGEEEYFNQLNREFEKYDTVLYELVAPEGTVIPKGGGRKDAIPTNPIAGMQKGMQAALGLEFQLEHIDYTKDNFRHADMTPEEFAESMVENDESISKYALKAIGQSIAMQSSGKSGDSFGMMMAMFSNNKELRLRQVFAKQMKEMESGLVMFNGKDGSTIIDHRNAKCMKVLEQELAKGTKKVAIFYGAGHLVDMERRLMSDFRMKRGGQTWLEAWELNERKSDSEDSEEK